MTLTDLDALVARLHARDYVAGSRAISARDPLVDEAAAALVQLRDRIAALEAERDECLEGAERWQSEALKVLGELTKSKAERDALRDLLRRLRQWDMLSEGNTPRLADRDYWCEQIDTAIAALAALEGK